MKIASINMSNYGSTGNIMIALADEARRQGDDVLLCYPATKKTLSKKVEDTYIIGNRIGRNIGIFFSKTFGCDNLLFRHATRRLVRRLKRFTPDVVHLHNLHGWYLNIPVLFEYLRSSGISVVWTFHDCWPVTGHCPHFDMIGCRKWQEGCGACPQLREYPASFIDNSKRMFAVKRKYFSMISNLTIVTPSQWLADIVKKSFLGDKRIVVINNGINLDVFKPVESDFRKRYNCEKKKILLGVAFGWGRRKGLDVFIRLAADLPSNYQIVLVGTDDEVDKLLPSNIISIRRTQNQAELAEIYSAADIFVNPTREEVFGCVNAEALACGTPIITFATGGSPEAIDESCGIVIPKDDYPALIKAITEFEKNRFPSEACILRSKKFAQSEQNSNYLSLYRQKMSDTANKNNLF